MVECPKCSAEVSPANLETEAGVGSCPVCGEVFELSTAVAAPVSANKLVGSGWEAVIPPGMELARAGQAMVLSFAWTRSVGLQFLVFGVIFALALGVIGMSSGVWIPPLVGAVGGLLSAYVGAAFLTNRTTLMLGKGELEIEHGPLPWPGGSQRYAIKQIKQLWVAKEVVPVGKGRTRTVFHLKGRIGGIDHKLIPDLRSREIAAFVERAVEEHLGIEDRRMPDEG